jgi:hypothetical protein
MLETPSQVIEFVGEEAVMAAVGVKRDAVRKAVKAGELPAAWYDALERLSGRPLPRGMFSFKPRTAA